VYDIAGYSAVQVLIYYKLNDDFNVRFFLQPWSRRQCQRPGIMNVTKIKWYIAKTSAL
jgi:hypothetical protein